MIIKGGIFITDTRYAITGVSRRTGERSFLYIPNNAGWIDSIPYVVKTYNILDDNVLHYSVYSCKQDIDRMKQITSDHCSEKFYDFKIIQIKSDCDLTSMQINVKLFELMDDGSLMELGVEYD